MGLVLAVFGSARSALGLGALGAVLVSAAGCVDGTTPNCAGDAGCGPGIEAGPDVSTDAVATDAGGDVTTGG